MTVHFGLPMFSPVSNMPIPTCEPTSCIVLNNVADWLDPTIYADNSLTVRAANANIVNTISWLNYIQSGGLMI